MTTRGPFAACAEQRGTFDAPAPSGELARSCLPLDWLMPCFRVRVELFKGQESVELSRLTVLPEELIKLFRSIADDAGVTPADNLWRANDFADGSLEFNALSSEELPAEVAGRCARIANAVFAGDADKAYAAGVTDRTLLQYGQLAKRVQPGEVICLGAYRTAHQERPTRLYEITAERVSRLTNNVHAYIEYHGAALGFIHSVFFGADKPHFDLRDISRDSLIKCFYRSGHYNLVVSALTPKMRRLHVSGMVRANRLNKTIDSIFVDRIELVSPMSNEEAEEFFGGAPDITGGLSTEEFISDARDDE